MLGTWPILRVASWHRSVRWVCHCGKVFPSSTRYHKHARLHSAERRFVCPVEGCCKAFKRSTHLTRHVAQHRVGKPHVCTFNGCAKSFATRQRLSKHMRCHGGLRCEDCGEHFRKRSMLEQHRRAHASAGSPAELRCPDCGRAVSNAKALTRHMKRHKQHLCADCGEVFRWHRELLAHQKLSHPKVHLCADCGKAYQREAALQEHRQRVHAETVFQCPHATCGQVFSSMSNLKVHDRVVHKGLRPFSCRICGQTFAYRHVLKRHCRLLHPGASPSRLPQESSMVPVELGMPEAVEGGFHRPAPSHRVEAEPGFTASASAAPPAPLRRQRIARVSRCKVTDATPATQRAALALSTPSMSSRRSRRTTGAGDSINSTDGFASRAGGSGVGGSSSSISSSSGGDGSGAADYSASPAVTMEELMSQLEAFEEAELEELSAELDTADREASAKSICTGPESPPKRKRASACVGHVRSPIAWLPSLRGLVQLHRSELATL